jgi:hypothetical protein
MAEKTKFGILKPTGEEVKTHGIDLSKIKSPDPIAYAYGLVHGESGEPLGKPEKGEKFAPEFIRGWKEGHKKYTENLKDVM